MEQRFKSFKKNEIEFKQYWKQILKKDEPKISETPAFHNWEFLSDAMMAELPVFKHMIDQRDLNYKMRNLARDERDRLAEEATL